MRGFVNDDLIATVGADGKYVLPLTRAETKAKRKWQEGK
jgi:hypothetical protein